MPYCSVADVRLLVKTGLTDAEVDALIELVDDEIDDWESDHEITLSARKKRRVSMRKAAILIAVREPEAAGAGDYGGFARDKITEWKQQINAILDGMVEIPFVTAHEPIE